MKLSKRTNDILKNYASINNGITFYEGNGFAKNPFIRRFDSNDIIVDAELLCHIWNSYKLEQRARNCVQINYF